MVTFGIVICSYNRRYLLERSLEYWSASNRLPDQVIIVDATEDAKSYYQEIVYKFPKLFNQQNSKYILSEKPGLTLQRNLGILALNTDVVCFADDDAFVAEDYLEKILEVFEEDKYEKIGGVNGVGVGQFDNPRQKYSRIAKNFFRHRFGWMAQRIRVPSRQLIHLYSPIPAELAHIPMINIDRLWGANMSYRTKFIRELSFDENFQRYGLFEDVDMSIRVGKTHKLVCRLDATIEHDDSLGQTTRPSEVKYFLISWLNSAYIIEKLFPFNESRNAHQRLFNLISLIPKVTSQEFCNSKFRVFGNKELRSVARRHIEILKECQNQTDLERTFVRLQDEIFLLTQ